MLVYIEQMTSRSLTLRSIYGFTILDLVNAGMIVISNKCFKFKHASYPKIETVFGLTKDGEFINPSTGKTFSSIESFIRSIFSSNKIRDAHCILNAWSYVTYEAFRTPATKRLPTLSFLKNEYMKSLIVKLESKIESLEYNRPKQIIKTKSAKKRKALTILNKNVSLSNITSRYDKQNIAKKPKQADIRSMLIADDGSSSSSISSIMVKQKKSKTPNGKAKYYNSTSAKKKVIQQSHRMNKEIRDQLLHIWSTIVLPCGKLSQELLYLKLSKKVGVEKKKIQNFFTRRPLITKKILNKLESIFVKDELPHDDITKKMYLQSLSSEIKIKAHDLQKWFEIRESKNEAALTSSKTSTMVTTSTTKTIVKKNIVNDDSETDEDEEDERIVDEELLKKMPPPPFKPVSPKPDFEIISEYFPRTNSYHNVVKLI